MTGEIETDYLVVGAGAAGMAFVDEVLTHSETTVTLVDRRSTPGGHWVDAYPHVRLHQPSTFYGVTSVRLGEDAIDGGGTNAGFYELAGAQEIRAYYERVMQRRFLPSGRVRYFPSCEYVGDHRFVSRLSGATTEARVKRRLVDTTYVEGSIPATSPPPFEVADGVRCVPAGDLPHVSEAPDRYVIVGAGKTALDTCVWLLERGVPASSIRWIKPREGWWINRRFQQPLTLFPDFYRGIAIQLEALAQAASQDDLFARLEADGIFLRIDRALAPTMFHGAIVSEAEVALLRQVEDVIRMGRVQRIDRGEIVLEGGRVPTTERTLHVHCASAGVRYREVRPIFEPGRMTMQPVQWGFACYQFAMLGVVEATVESDEEKNRLCPPIRYWDRNEDYVPSFVASVMGERARGQHPAIGAWMKTTRLNPAGGISAYREDPRVVESRERIKRAAMPALMRAAALAARPS